MADYDPAHVRAVLRENGREVPERGRISASHIADYEQLAGLDGPAGDDGGGDATAALAAPDAAFTVPRQAEPPAAEQADMAEKTPRARKPRRRAPRARSLREMFGGKPAARRKTAGKDHAWVSTAEVIEHFWSQLAWSARPLPPLQKILAMQAPMAGVVLEDVTRQTVLDRLVLQPAARLEAKLQGANAMLGPPLWTLAIATMGGAEADEKGQPKTDENGEFVYDERTRVLIGGLRFSLMSWIKIGGKRAEQIIEQAEELRQLGDEVDALISYILAPPQPGQSAKDITDEAAGKGADFLARAQEAAAGGPAAADLAGVSAFTPAPAAGPSGSL